MSDPAYTIWRGPDAVLIRDAHGGQIILANEDAKALCGELEPRRRQKFRWTTEVDAELRRLYAIPNMTTREITNLIGAPSVNAVAQRISRLGIANRNPKQQAKMRNSPYGRRIA